MKLYGGKVGDDAVPQDHTFDKALHVQHIASVKAVGAFQPTALVHLSGWEIPLPGWVQGSAICSTRYPTTKTGRVTGSQWPWFGLSCVLENSNTQLLECRGRATVPAYSALRFGSPVFTLAPHSVAALWVGCSEFPFRSYHKRPSVPFSASG